MLIALDYDKTYTLDPEFWLKFVRLAEKHGHKVLVATMRTLDEKGDMCDALLEAVPQVVPTHRNAKLPFLQSWGLKPDVWIDDQPHFILVDALDADKSQLGPK